MFCDDRASAQAMGGKFLCAVNRFGARAQKQEAGLASRLPVSGVPWESYFPRRAFFMPVPSAAGVPPPVAGEPPRRPLPAGEPLPVPRWKSGS